MMIAHNIYYTIGPKAILNNVSARIALGKMTAILGPNGAGKSTMLKCLTGALKPNGGTIQLDNKNLATYSLAQLSKKRAVLSQSNPINFPFRAVDIVMMGRNPYGHHQQNMDTARCVMEELDVWALRDRIFPTLSGGEQQRLQLARVLAQLWDQKRAYIFLDEPTSALDLKYQHQLLHLVRRLVRHKRFAACMIIHDMNLALRYADQAILLKDGACFAAGSIKSVLNANNIEEVFQIDAALVLHGQKSKKALAQA